MTQVPRTAENPRGRTTANAVRSLGEYLAETRGDASLASSDIRSSGSGVGPMLTRSDDAFCYALEPGVRELVLTLIDRIGCETYSSCEGHRSGSSIIPCHVGMVAENEKSQRRLSSQLIALTAPDCRRDVRPEVVSGTLTVGQCQRPCIDLVFYGSGVSPEHYFAGLPRAIDRLLRRMERSKQSRSCMPSRRYFKSSILEKLGFRLHAAKPYPFILLPDFISRTALASLRKLAREATWSRMEHAAYALGSSRLLCHEHDPCGEEIRTLFTTDLAFVVGSVARQPAVRLESLELHKMSPGDQVGIHNDMLDWTGACWRAIIYLDTVAHEDGGTHLILSREAGGRFRLRRSVTLVAGDMLLFAISDLSLHAVTPLRRAVNRRTLVATYSCL